MTMSEGQCPAAYADSGASLICVLWPGHDGPHWHRPTPKVSILEKYGIHWFDMSTSMRQIKEGE